MVKNNLEKELIYLEKLLNICDERMINVIQSQWNN